jgi:small subunit ribosomal protein S21
MLTEQKVCCSFGTLFYFFAFKNMPIEVKIRKNEAVDKALRRLKKRLDRESILLDLRAKRYFVKPSMKRRLKRKEQAFTDMLRNRYANM